LHGLNKRNGQQRHRHDSRLAFRPWNNLCLWRLSVQPGPSTPHHTPHTGTFAERSPSPQNLVQKSQPITVMWCRNPFYLCEGKATEGGKFSAWRDTHVVPGTRKHRSGHQEGAYLGRDNGYGVRTHATHVVPWAQSNATHTHTKHVHRRTLPGTTRATLYTYIPLVSYHAISCHIIQTMSYHVTSCHIIPTVTTGDPNHTPKRITSVSTTGQVSTFSFPG